MATARAAMPEPVEFDWHTTLVNGFASGGLAGFAAAVVDVKTKSDQASESRFRHGERIFDVPGADLPPSVIGGSTPQNEQG